MTSQGHLWLGSSRCNLVFVGVNGFPCLHIHSRLNHRSHSIRDDCIFPAVEQLCSSLYNPPLSLTHTHTHNTAHAIRLLSQFQIGERDARSVGLQDDAIFIELQYAVRPISLNIGNVVQFQIGERDARSVGLQDDAIFIDHELQYAVHPISLNIGNVVLESQFP
jgi:hypothetical protein